MQKMTDRERLIEILKVKIYPKIGADPTDVVADYLLDNGVIVLPCKAGDTVYFLDLRSLIIRELKVVEIEITTPNNAMLLFLSDSKLHGVSDYGISLFYTKEEAEKALAERSVSDAH